MTAYTAEQLRQRLLEISETFEWGGAYRSMAKAAASPYAAEHGFAIEPADLSDDAIREALKAASLARLDRPVESIGTAGIDQIVADMEANGEDGQR